MSTKEARRNRRAFHFLLRFPSFSLLIHRLIWRRKGDSSAIMQEGLCDSLPRIPTGK